MSSTYYDLKYVRSSLELFIYSLGFDPVLSEYGGIAYEPDKALDESCYREVQNCDIYVLIIGGRYGSEVSETRKEQRRAFFEGYESVTKKEYHFALVKDIPIYVLIDKSVFAEYQTYLKNPSNEGIFFAHVDHAGVFRLVDQVLSQRRNNPMQTFDRPSEIEDWLRSQWAGLYRELLDRRMQQKQITSLSQKVNELGEVSRTLKRYLEDLIANLNPEKAKGIIREESERLAEAELVSKIMQNDFMELFVDGTKGAELLIQLLRDNQTYPDFMRAITSLPRNSSILVDMIKEVDINEFIDLMNKVRDQLGLRPYDRVLHSSYREKAFPARASKEKGSPPGRTRGNRAQHDPEP